MKDMDRLAALYNEQMANPYATTYQISDANFNFLLRIAESYHKLRGEYNTLKETNHDLESQIDQITTVVLSRRDKPILERYHDIRDILGVTTLV